jgi:hypothetical protein
MRTPTLRRLAAAAAAVAVAVVVAAGAPTGTNIAMGPHGGVADGSVGAPLPLAPGMFLVAASGPDGTLGTADDLTLLVTGAGGGGIPAITPLATPGLSGYSGRMARLAGTRALVPTSGADLAWSTADDAVLLLDALGSANTVTPIVVGGLAARDVYAPVALGSDAAALATRGPDNTITTGDDSVAIVTGIGTTNTVVHAAAPFLADQAGSRPTALTTDAFLVGALGPDGLVRTADDEAYLFTGARGAEPARADLATPFRGRRASGHFVRVAADRAVACGAGADGAESTADDELLLLDDLGGANTVTPIPVPFLFDYGAGRPTPLSATVVVVAGCGPDGDDGTADDRVSVVTGLGTTNTVTHLTTGSLDEDGQCRPVVLGPTTVAFCGSGLDDSLSTADDDLLVIEGVGTTNTLRRFPVGGALAAGITSEVVPFGERAAGVTSLGADGSSGTGDEFFALVTWDDAAGLVETDSLGGGIVAQDYGDEFVAAPLGRGAAVLATTGPDGLFVNADDFLRLLEGLPADRSLAVKIGFKESKPEKGATVSLKGTLLAPGADVFAGRAVTVTLGNASQSLPGGAFVANKAGVIQYKDPKGLAGFVRKLVWNPKNGSLVVKAKGTDSGAEGTDPALVVVTVEGGDLLLGDVFAGTAFAGGIKYKAPKGP